MEPGPTPAAALLCGDNPEQTPHPQLPSAHHHHHHQPQALVTAVSSRNTRMFVKYFEMKPPILTKVNYDKPGAAGLKTSHHHHHAP